MTVFAGSSIQVHLINCTAPKISDLFINFQPFLDAIRCANTVLRKGLNVSLVVCWAVDWRTMEEEGNISAMRILVIYDDWNFIS